MNDKYNLLKSVIQAANPEIMELQFGCVAKFGGNPDYHRIGTIVGKSDSGNYSILFDFGGLSHYRSNQIAEVFGRPIRLADVLLAMSTLLPTDGSLEGKRAGLIWNDGTLVLSKNAFWNLKDDDLNKQSEECKDFLIKLLVL